MALAAVIRRSSSAIVPLFATLRRSTNRLLRRSFTHRELPFFSSISRSFSASPSASAARLVKVIEDEIKSSIESGGHEEIPVPSGFPFKIIDNPGDETITLKREYAGETISVVVLNPEAAVNMGDTEDEHSGNEDGSLNLSISLNVTISKGNGSILEFNCSVSSEDIHIHHMTIKNGSVSEAQRSYEGPSFSDLDENLQNEFYKYLEARGIESSLFGFLHDYMIKKDDSEYLTWLGNMKTFMMS